MHSTVVEGKMKESGGGKGKNSEVRAGVCFFVVVVVVFCTANR
ncbi:hypothetical protein TCSYLVIO_002456, partial [Trypanosoma cruzi]